MHFCVTKGWKQRLRERGGGGSTSHPATQTLPLFNFSPLLSFNLGSHFTERVCLRVQQEEVKARGGENVRSKDPKFARQSSAKASADFNTLSLFRGKAPECNMHPSSRNEVHMAAPNAQMQVHAGLLQFSSLFLEEGEGELGCVYCTHKPLCKTFLVRFFPIKRVQLVENNAISKEFFPFFLPTHPAMPTILAIGTITFQPLFLSPTRRNT